jgi:phosphoribosylamine---glycine ligase
MLKINRILVLGSGGREHVFTWKLSQELSKDNLFVAPGNAGLNDIATAVAIGVNDFDAIAQFCIDNKIDCVLPGSEDPLVNGIVDYFKKEEKLKHIYVFGPNKEAAQLEGSKSYCKAFMQRHGIPTAAYQSFDASTLNNGLAFLDSLQAPYVLKADGLAAGKGVLIIDNLPEAKEELTNMLMKAKFGKASECVVIEEFLGGIEFSVFVAMDGKNAIVLPEAKDYKRIGEKDTGLNTGGMGAVSPVPFANSALMQKVMETIVNPTVAGLVDEGLDFNGFIFFGLISENGVPKVIEYNVRMGDPETEVVFPRIKSSFSQLLEMAANKRLDNYQMEIDKRVCTTVFAASGGYPGDYPKGKTIEIETINDTILFHAGTALNADNKLVTNGGRVIAASAFGNSIAAALENAYEALKNVKFEGMYYRKDIGQDLMNESSGNN